jgi:hypothetical protein
MNTSAFRPNTELGEQGTDCKRLQRLDSICSTRSGGSLDDEHSHREDLDQVMSEQFVSLLGLPVPHTLPVKLIAKAIKILRVCKYGVDDISAVLAITYFHHKRFISTISREMTITERSFLILAQVYISHCYLLDECCKVSNWHRYLFVGYCDLPSLNRAIMKILTKMDYHLSVDPNDIEELSALFLFPEERIYTQHS